MIFRYYFVAGLFTTIWCQKFVYDGTPMGEAVPASRIPNSPKNRVNQQPRKQSVIQQSHRRIRAVPGSSNHAETHPLMHSETPDLGFESRNDSFVATGRPARKERSLSRGSKRKDERCRLRASGTSDDRQSIVKQARKVYTTNRLVDWNTSNRKSI